MESICIIVRKAPYGVIQAGEALRHISGAVVHKLKTTAVLLDDGVYLAKANQAGENTGWPSLADGLKELLEVSKGNPPKIFIHAESMKNRGLHMTDMIKGAEEITDDQLAQILSDTKTVMIF